MVVAFWTTLIPNMIGYIYPPSAGWFATDPAEAQAVIQSILQQPGWKLYGRVIPLIFGIMLLMRLAPKMSWMSRWPMALIIGFAAGTNLTRYLQSDFVAQIKSTLIPLIVVTDGSFSLGGTFTNLVIVFGVLSALIYFFFSKEHKGWFGATARGGIWILMVAFGAAFGYTVMARISLLIGRMNFMGQWLGSIF
jgi:lipoprotein signal peptidase